MPLLGKMRLQLGQRNVVTHLDDRKDLLPLRFDPRREPVATAGLRSWTARLSVASAPADRARHAYTKPLRSLPPRHPT